MIKIISLKQTYFVSQLSSLTASLSYYTVLLDANRNQVHVQLKKYVKIGVSSIKPIATNPVPSPRKIRTESGSQLCLVVHQGVNWIVYTQNITGYNIRIKRKANVKQNSTQFANNSFRCAISWAVYSLWVCIVLKKLCGAQQAYIVKNTIFSKKAKQSKYFTQLYSFCFRCCLNLNYYEVGRTITLSLCF